MKKLPLFLFLAVLNSCGDGNKNDDNKASKVNSEDLINTRYIKAEEIACNYTNGEKDFDAKSLNGEIISGVLQTNLEIRIPYSLSLKIISELRKHSNKNKKINAKSFWNILSDAGKNKLNDYLIEKYGSLNNEKFNLKRKLVAYAFTIYTELEENQPIKKKFKQAIRFKSNHNKEFEEFTIAFSDDIREIVDLGICNPHDINNIEVPNNTLLPSNILTNVVCEQFDTRNKIVFKMYDDYKLHINLNSDQIIDEVVINSEDITTYKTRNFKNYKYSGDGYNISFQIKANKIENAYYSHVYRTYISNTIDYLNIEIEKHGHSKIKLKRVDCEPVKPFVI